MNKFITLILINVLSRSKSERRRSFIGSQLEECKDYSSLFYLLPFQKGYLVNWDTQRQVWDHTFQEVFKLTPLETNLTFTEPPFNFPSIQDSLNEIFFEEYQFKSVLITQAATLSAAYQLQKHPNRLCCMVVDTGYSFTHLVPTYKAQVVLNGVARLDVGGKLLTNHLKEIVSYRQLNVLDETYVMNQVKEEACFVSQDLYSDMSIARQKGPTNTLLREYVLPDYTNVKNGYMREPGAKSSNDEQCLRLANERFTIPEILFNPSDIGIPQMGIPEALVHSVMATPMQMQPHLFNNILLSGGNSSFSGFYERFCKEVRQSTPDLYDVDVTHLKQPSCTAWYGGKALAGGVQGLEHIQPVTLAEYKEYGHSICRKHFHENQVWTSERHS